MTKLDSAPVYITGMGAFLPGAPVGNDEMEDYLGKIGGKPSRLRERVLKQNGIRSRHYAIDKEQRTLYRNSEMAALAVKSALQDGGIGLSDVELLVAATTQGDLPIPGFASMVHGELKSQGCEVATMHGVCASGMMAMKHAYLQVKCGEKKTAVACASELPSRLFKASRYEGQKKIREEGRLDFNTEFLRWMLSDGAGAAVLRSEMPRRGLALEVQWIELKSFAGQTDVCMYVGSGEGETVRSWLDYPSYEDAAVDGAINLKQDVGRLDLMVKLGVDMFLELIEHGKVKPDALDWIVCHYSSGSFLEQIHDSLAKFGIVLPRERWFSNLHSKGNVGSASVFVMLEELLHGGRLKPGQTVLCMVPESGRYSASYMMLKVVGTADEKLAPVDTPSEPAPPEIPAGGSPLRQDLLRRLARVWIDFETRLDALPTVADIRARRLSPERYRLLLKDWRQQVCEGSRWIARAASNIPASAGELRSLFIRHAKDEHRDFEMLEKNYVAAGGQLDEIRNGEKNLGSEALNAWMFQRASREAPWDLLGAMFIIEGLGSRKASGWAKSVKEALGVGDDAVSFLAYHGAGDEEHLGKLDEALDLIPLDAALADAVVKTAKVTARLYILQFEELGRY